MDGMFKIVLALGAGGFGLGAMNAGDLNAVDLSSLNLEMLKDIASDVKEAVNYVREEGVNDLAKILKSLQDMQK